MNTTYQSNAPTRLERRLARLCGLTRVRPRTISIDFVYRYDIHDLTTYDR